MKRLRRWQKDLIWASAISAFLVVLLLWPYWENSEVLLVTKYRATLLFFASLALPLIDLLPDIKWPGFLYTAAAITWAVNSLAFFLVAELLRLAIRGTNILIARLKPHLC